MGFDKFWKFALELPRDLTWKQDLWFPQLESFFFFKLPMSQLKFLPHGARIANLLSKCWSTPYIRFAWTRGGLTSSCSFYHSTTWEPRWNLHSWAFNVKFIFEKLCLQLRSVACKGSRKRQVCELQSWSATAKGNGFSCRNSKALRSPNTVLEYLVGRIR